MGPAVNTMQLNRFKPVKDISKELCIKKNTEL